MNYSCFKIVVTFTTTLSIFSCSKNYSSSSMNPPPGTGAPGTAVKLATSQTLGDYLVDDQGRSLYLFAGDADGNNSCASCEALWPSFTGNAAALTLGSGLSAADFGNIENPAGAKQITYKGWPLYTHTVSTQDGYGNATNSPEAAGVTGGDGADGLRFIAKPNYTIMLASKQLTGQDGRNYTSDYKPGNGATTYFTDGSGKTIYRFILDSFNVNKFTAADFSNDNLFPIYQNDEIVVPSVIDKTQFNKLLLSGTKKQFTYKGWPLYFFGGDTRRGSNAGITVPQVGDWPVVTKDVASAPKP